MTSSLPSHHKALVVHEVGDNHKVESRPVPQPTHGSAVVRILAAGVINYLREIYNGRRHYSFPTPLVPGSSSIARIAAVGPDATLLKQGQLVYVDCVIRGRDDRNTIFLSAIHDSGKEGSQKLMRDVWRDGPMAEYQRVPLENCIPLDEARLCGELGYSTEQLMYMHYLLVPYGGLRDIKLEPGETVVVCPATGGYGGAAVQVAVAMGARVITMGRSDEKLSQLREHIKSGTPGANVETVKITGDAMVDLAALKAFGTIDAVIDFSPSEAKQSTHLKSAIMALRRGGRVSLMGMNEAFLSIWTIIGNDISFRGKLMYEREDMLQFVKMLERGLFPRGTDFVDIKTFKLEEWKEAFDTAATHTGVGHDVVIKP